jgi:hypothetical protein
MTELRTRESLLSALKLAASRRPTAEELQKQRISFIMGSINDKSTVTRARISEVLAAQEGKKTA